MSKSYGTIFLSHASADKPLVESIYRRLDAANTFYDIKTIDPGEAFIDAMRRGVAGQNIFVLFHSPNTINTWVEFEKRLEEVNHAANGGALFVIPIGGETYQSLPGWMKGFMTATEHYNASDVARTIIYLQNKIVKLQENNRDVIVGREDLCRRIHLTVLQNVPKYGIPLQHVVLTGLPGMGRNTVAGEVIRNSFGMMRSAGPVFDLPDMAEAVNFYLTFKQDIDGLMSKEEIEKQIVAFGKLSPEAQAKAIHAQAKHWADLNQPIVVKTRWGLRDRSRHLKPWFDAFLRLSEGTPSLRIIYVSERRLPEEEIFGRKNISQFPIGQLNDVDIQIILSKLIEPRHFDASKSEEFSQLILGHPATAHYMALLVNAGRNLDTLKANPEPVVAFQNRALDTIFSSDAIGENQKKIIALLGLFPRLSLNMMARVLHASPADVATELWEIIDYSLVVATGADYYSCPDVVASRSRRELGELSAPLLTDVKAQIEADIDAGKLDTNLIEALMVSTVELAGGIPTELRGLVTSSTLLTIVTDRFHRARAMSKGNKAAFESTYNLSRIALDMKVSDDAVEQILFTGGDSAIRAGLFPGDIIDRMEQAALPSVYYLRGSYAFHVEKDLSKAIKNLRIALSLKHFKLRNTRLLARALIRNQNFSDALSALNDLTANQLERETGLLILKIRALRGMRLHKEADDLEKKLSGADDEYGDVALFNAAKLLREMKLPEAVEQLEIANRAPRVNQFTRQLLECAVRIEAGDPSLLPLVAETAISVNRHFDAWQLQARHAVVEGKWQEAEALLAKIERKDYYDLQIERRCLELKMRDPDVSRDVALVRDCELRLEEVARLSVNSPEGFRDA
ncbi:MAG: toll/interleukin-1 receptor domain-containing protein [Rhizobiaceae bacterium]